MKPHYDNGRVTLWHGDCLNVLTELADNSIDSIVTDPPYSLTDRREKYCASDMLRDAIVTDAQYPDAKRREGMVTISVTVSKAWAMGVCGVDLDGQASAGEKEIHNNRPPVRQHNDMLMNRGDSMPGEKITGGDLRLWVRQGASRCIGTCRCLGKGSDGTLRVPVRFRDDPACQPERPSGVMTAGGTELGAVLSFDAAKRTAELLPASGADVLDPPFEILCAQGVGALTGTTRRAAVSESGCVGDVGEPAGRALTFDLAAHRSVLSWRPSTLRGFMSSLWDGTGIETDVRLWKECLRVLKPGGHLLAFGGTRTFHRVACAIEDAGFTVRDSIAYLFGSGFPKSHDVAKAIDREAGAERVDGGREWRGGQRAAGILGRNEGTQTRTIYDAPATPEAERWQGWGTALKPGHEPIILARKPFPSTVAANVQEWGTGALNIDGCRIGDEVLPEQRAGDARLGTFNRTNMVTPERAGRWPANVALDADQAAALDQQSGDRGGGFGVRGGGGGGDWNPTGRDEKLGQTIRGDGQAIGYGDQGGASRFFYTAKADSNERPRINGIAHSTVKPLDLVRWLVRLITPPGGTVLDPFGGSGTTAEAAILERFRAVVVEREADFLPLIVQRVIRRVDPVEAIRQAGGDLGLFE